MEYAELVDRILGPKPLPLETGYERLPDGVLHVAARTDMHGCTGAMFEWWFRSRPGTREYVWWHPLDHIESTWVEGSSTSHVGAIHQVIERFTGGDAERLSIQFIEPAEIFPAAALETARSAGHLSGLVCARGGSGHPPSRRPDGAVVGTRLIHLCRDTRWGLALRSHFYLGLDLPAVGLPPAELHRVFPDELAPRLLQHCYDEFTFLSRVLPGLFEAESRTNPPPERPW